MKGTDTRAVSVELTNIRPLNIWKPIHGDLLISSKMFATWFGLVVDVDNTNETIDIIYAGSPQVLLSMSPLERTKRRKQLDIRQIKESSHFTVSQNYGGKSIWYVR